MTWKYVAVRASWSARRENPNAFPVLVPATNSHCVIINVVVGTYFQVRGVVFVSVTIRTATRDNLCPCRLGKRGEYYFTKPWHEEEVSQ